MPRKRWKCREEREFRTGADNVPNPKQQPEESVKAKILKALKEAKKRKQKKATKRKLDVVLSRSYPNAVIHEDYTCMLNQRDIGQNTNKFYVIQVARDKNTYLFFTRWGHVGEEGKNNTDVFSKKEDATKAFEKKFKYKTKNNWDDRENFKADPKKYILVDKDDSIGEKKVAPELPRPKIGLGISKSFCSLHPRTQLMIRLIFCEDMFLNQMTDMNLDVKKMPLDKLSEAQITEGLETLVDIEEAIKTNKSRKTLMELSSKFFTLIPHTFSRSRPPVIDSYDVLIAKKEVMYTLSDIELAQRMQKQETKAVHPIRGKYETLGCSLEYIDKLSSEYRMVQEYATASPLSRKGYLLGAWRVDRKGEQERFAAHNDITHRMLLWHGSNVAEVAAILKEGLKIKPYSWDFLGAGIYFTPDYANSASIVGVHPVFEYELDIGFMFLVEVALGKEYNVTHGDCFLTEAPKGYDSVVGRGEKEPDPKKNKKVVFDGKDVTVPLGSPVPQKEWAGTSFWHTEYVVYKESQARIRYMLKFSFD